MAFQKYDATAATKTHGAIDATLIEVMNPFGPSLVGTTENLLRGLVIGAAAWVGRGYRDNGSFSL